MYVNNGFNPKIAHGKDIKNPSRRQVNRSRLRLIKTMNMLLEQKKERNKQFMVHLCDASSNLH